MNPCQMFQNQSQPSGSLTEKPSLETVRAAIKTVLSQDAGNNRKPASDWLEALKSSIYAWEICDQLLAPHEGIEVNYLAAHMLRQKISKNFNELPIEYYSSLKDSILNQLQNNEDYAVQGQLTLCLADLALLLQNWLNPIEDLAKQLGLDVGLVSLFNTDHAAIYKALHNRLIFGYVMHQMCDLNHNQSERPSRIGARRREEYEDYLISKCKQATSWWLSTVTELDEVRVRLEGNYVGAQNKPQKTQEDEIIIKIFKLMDKLIGQIYLCYSAWLRIFDEENVNDSLPLIDAAFRHLKNTACSDTVHKYAVEVVRATASFCEGNTTVNYLIEHIIEQIYNLEPAFRQTLEEEDLEKSSNFVKAFTSIAETACFTNVIETRNFKLIELMLCCLNHYDYEVIEETYNFWWTFLDNLQQKLKHSEYGPFIPYINRFIISVTKLCQFDPDEISVASTDLDIHQFRLNTAEIIRNVIYVTTVEDFLRDNMVLDNLSLDLSTISWDKLESILYLLTCLVQLMTRDENHLRMRIFQCILIQQTRVNDFQSLLLTKQVPIKIGVSPGEVHPQLIATSLEIIGSFENFLADHPDYLALAINYILTSLSHPTYRIQLIKSAASALCNIMEYNAMRHFSSCPELLIIVKDLCTSLDQFDEQAASELLRCSAFMAEAIKESKVKDDFLCEILNINITSLKAVLSSSGSEADAVKYLDRLSVVFKQASIPSETLPELVKTTALIDTELWPIILKVLEKYAPDSGHTIERTCRTIRYLLRCFKPEWMIERVAETMVNLYKTYPQNSSPLYICSILVDEFANKNPEINQGLFTMLQIFCTLTFTLLKMNASQNTSLLTMKSYPETIDDMMRLFNRFLRKCPSDFVNCEALESIIELSISSLRIDHPEANSSVSKFVIAFITLGQSNEYPRIREAIKNVLGARFTDAVIKACLFDIAEFHSLIGEEAAILLTLNSFDKDLFNTWIEATVSSLPKTNIQGIESVTSDQLEDFKKTITTAGSLKKIVNCLRAFARLYT